MYEFLRNSHSRQKLWERLKEKIYVHFGNVFKTFPQKTFSIITLYFQNLHGNIACMSQKIYTGIAFNVILEMFSCCVDRIICRN